MAELKNDDLLLVNRAGETYTAPGEAIYSSYLDKPKIGNFSLVESNPGVNPRFTDQEFVATLTMTEEGQPVSKKTFDAFVEGAILEDVQFIEPLESSFINVIANLSDGCDPAWINPEKAFDVSDFDNHAYLNSYLADTFYILCPNGFEVNSGILEIHNQTSIPTTLTVSITNISTGVEYTEGWQAMGTGWTNEYYTWNFGGPPGIYTDLKFKTTSFGQNPRIFSIKADGQYLDSSKYQPTDLTFANGTNMAALAAGDTVTQPTQSAIPLDPYMNAYSVVGYDDWASNGNLQGIINGTYTYATGTPTATGWDHGNYYNLTVSETPAVVGDTITVHVGNGAFDVWTNLDANKNRVTGTDYTVNIVPGLTNIYVGWFAITGAIGKYKINGVTLGEEYTPTGTVGSVIGTTVSLATSASTWVDNQDVTGPTKTIQVDGTKKYLAFTGTGQVTGLRDTPQSPAYVTTEEDPVLTLTFPSTFPSGFTPDEELGEGVTLTVEVTAENAVGTDGPVSDTVQPMVVTPTTSAIIQIDEEPNPNGGWKRLDAGGGANYMWGIVYSNIEKIFVTTGYNNANPAGAQGIRWSEDGLTWYPGYSGNSTNAINSDSNHGIAYAEDKQLYGVITSTLPGKVSYSTSAKTGWSSFRQLDSKADQPYCITYSKYHGKFFVGGGSNSWGAWIYSSPDMVNWTLVKQFPASFNGFGITALDYNETTGRMVAGTSGYNGGVSGPTFRLAYSDDEGATWIDCTFTQDPGTSPYITADFMRVCYNKEADAWVAGGGDSYTSECLWRSTDGITWTPIPETLDKEGGNTVFNESCGVSNGYFFNYKKIYYSSTGTNVRKILISEDGLSWYGGPYNTVGGNESPSNFAFDGKRTYVGTGVAVSASANAWWSDDLGLPYEKLTFQDNTGLTLFSNNDVVHSLDQTPEVTRAVVDSVTPGSNQMVVKGSVGEWQLGGKVEQVIPAGAISLTAEELEAQKLKFLTYNNRKDVVCGEEAAAARAALLATLTEAGYTEADINQTYSNLDN